MGPPLEGTPEAGRGPPSVAPTVCDEAQVVISRPSSVETASCSSPTFRKQRPRRKQAGAASRTGGASRSRSHRASSKRPPSRRLRIPSYAGSEFMGTARGPVMSSFRNELPGGKGLRCRPAMGMNPPFARHRIVRDVSVPAFLYGTAWKEDRTEELARLALGAGFRGIDTANQRRHYVEAAVGDAVAAFLREGKLTREDVFLQTKFTFPRGQDHRLPYDRAADPATQVQQSFESSLDHLRTTHVDSYVLHGPSSPDGVS